MKRVSEQLFQATATLISAHRANAAGSKREPEHPFESWLPGSKSTPNYAPVLRAELEFFGALEHEVTSSEGVMIARRAIRDATRQLQELVALLREIDAAKGKPVALRDKIAAQIVYTENLLAGLK